MDGQAVTVPELLQWFDMIRKQRFKLFAEDDFDTTDSLVFQRTAAMCEIIENMDLQAGTVPELLQWFDMIWKQRSKVLAENEDNMNADVVLVITAAMDEITEKILSLIRGKLPFYTPTATSSNGLRRA